MRNMILAAAAALILAGNVAPAFAAQRGNGGNSPPQHSDSSNVDSHCASILADAPAHSASDVAYCRRRT